MSVQLKEETASQSHSRKDEETDLNDDEAVEVEEDSDDETEYEEIDLTENPLYQVLSAFFENEDGENLCDHLAKLILAVESNTKMMEKLLKQKK